MEGNLRQLIDELPKTELQKVTESVEIAKPERKPADSSGAHGNSDKSHD